MITTTEFYKDFYGCSASVKHNRNGATLTVRTPFNKLIKQQKYKTRRGALIALGKLSDCWKFTGMKTSGKIKL